MEINLRDSNEESKKSLLIGNVQKMREKKSRRIANFPKIKEKKTYYTLLSLFV